MAYSISRIIHRSLGLGSLRYGLANAPPSSAHGLIRRDAWRTFTAAVGIKDKIDEIVKKSKVVVFMKGVPDAPRCGFSNAVVQIFRMHGVNYQSHDVLQDEDLRQGIKDYSNWPTIPQVFIDGQFVGGCDILLQMHQNGELIEELKKIGIKSSLLDKKDEGERGGN